MGKGIASAFKARYPDMFKAYRKLCKEGRFHIGQLWLWKASNQWILNFPTKQHWRNPSKLSYVEAGLQKFVDQYEARGIREIAFPRLGCGNGGLDWRDVRPLMERYLKPLPIPVYIHDFEVDIGLPEHREVIGGKHFQRSFATFLDDLDVVLRRQDGKFQTVSNQSRFHAVFDSSRNLLIRRPNRQTTVPNDDLFELWTLLLRGPVTRRRLPGAARDSAYYIFPILAELPYVRPIEIGQSDDAASIAIELMDLEFASDAMRSAEGTEGQSELEWA